MTIIQLSFDFTYPNDQRGENRRRASWRVRRISKRYDLPIRHAALIADLAGFPLGRFE